MRQSKDADGAGGHAPSLVVVVIVKPEATPTPLPVGQLPEPAAALLEAVLRLDELV